MKGIVIDLFFATDAQINSVEIIMNIYLLKIPQINYICL